jgi:cytochrome P450
LRTGLLTRLVQSITPLLDCEEFVFSAGAKWKNRRRIITPAFHDKELLNNFMDIYNEQSTILIQRLDKIQREKEVNLYPYIAACALDIICGELIDIFERSRKGIII